MFVAELKIVVGVFPFPTLVNHESKVLCGVPTALCREKRLDRPDTESRMFLIDGVHADATRAAGSSRTHASLKCFFWNPGSAQI